MGVVLLKFYTQDQNGETPARSDAASRLAFQGQLSVLRLGRREVVLKEPEQKVLERARWLSWRFWGVASGTSPHTPSSPIH